MIVLHCVTKKLYLRSDDVILFRIVHWHWGLWERVWDVMIFALAPNFIMLEMYTPSFAFVLCRLGFSVMSRVPPRHSAQQLARRIDVRAPVTRTFEAECVRLENGGQGRTKGTLGHDPFQGLECGLDLVLRSAVVKERAERCCTTNEIREILTGTVLESSSSVETLHRHFPTAQTEGIARSAVAIVLLKAKENLRR